MLPRGLTERFERIESLGPSGSGDLYRAHDCTTNRSGLLKVLHPHTAGTDKARQALTRLLGRQAEVDCPDLVVPLASGISDERVWLMRPWIDGVDLGAQLAPGIERGPEQIATIVADVANALGALHRSGLSHGDLKPRHVIVTEQGRGRLIDAGVVTTLELADGRRIAGAPGYVAPEIVQGEAPSSRSDLYSLGAFIHALLTGGAPYASAEPSTTIQAQLAGAELHLAADIDAPVRQLVIELLDVEPVRRPFTARRITRVMQAWVPSLPPTRAIESDGVGNPSGAPTPDPPVPDLSDLIEITGVRGSDAIDPHSWEDDVRTGTFGAATDLVPSNVPPPVPVVTPSEPVATIGQTVVTDAELRSIEREESAAQDAEFDTLFVRRPIPQSAPPRQHRRWFGLVLLVLGVAASVLLIRARTPSIDASPGHLRLADNTPSTAPDNGSPANDAPSAAAAGTTPANNASDAAATTRYETVRTQARAAYRDGRFQAARDAYTEAAALNPQSAGMFAGLGASAMKLGDFQRALSAYKQAVRKSPDNANYWVALGRAYQGLGKTDYARKAFLRALSLDKANAHAQASIAKLSK